MLVKTKKNCYYYSQKLKKILLLHPILYQIVKVKGDIEKIKRWLDTKKSFTTIQPSMNKIEYYYQKYQLLKDNEYFEMPILQKKNFFRYKASDIEYHLCGNRHVIFEVTENCNLKCKYCGYGGFYSNYSKRYNRNLSFKKAKILIDYMVKHWNFNENRSHNAEIRIDFYGGEPLLNFSFIRKMVRYINGIKLKHNYFTFGITN